MTKEEGVDGRDFVFGVEVEALAPGLIPMEVICFVKAVDEDGDPTMVRRYSDGLSPEEAIGILLTASDVIRSDLADAFWDDTEE